MNIFYNGQLLTTAVTVVYRGRTLIIDDVIIDTGSSHTVISPDILEAIGVLYENGDKIYEAYGIGGSVPFYTKVMEEIKIDTFSIKEFELDVGMLPEGHNGLLGLDILKEHGFIINMDKLAIYQSE
ncbi:aspartyl protease family protein [Radiobacillus sp. PE A8.2]|uniref:aspartyl protease family protein n=1 Tax=Radiobacillus sp. PE A8.2 TaxID=3380349 RepID=UPI00388EC046